MPPKKVKWLEVVEPVLRKDVCSFCGVLVQTLVQQEIHERWHRAVGIVPLEAESEPDTL